MCSHYVRAGLRLCARAPLRTQTWIPPLDERGCCTTLFSCVRGGGGEEAAQKTHHRILSRSSHAPHLSTQLTLELACSSPPKSTINDCGAHLCGFLLFEGCFLLNSFTNDQLRWSLVMGRTRDLNRFLWPSCFPGATKGIMEWFILL